MKNVTKMYKFIKSYGIFSKFVYFSSYVYKYIAFFLLLSGVTKSFDNFFAIERFVQKKKRDGRCNRG